MNVPVQVAPTLVPLLKFYFHEEVRRAAVSGIFFFCVVPRGIFFLQDNSFCNVFGTCILSTDRCLSLLQLCRNYCFLRN